jgi:hypothetical protein
LVFSGAGLMPPDFQPDLYPSPSGYGSTKQKRIRQWVFEDTVCNIGGVVDERAGQTHGKDGLLADTGSAADNPDTGA